MCTPVYLAPTLASAAPGVGAVAARPPNILMIAGDEPDDWVEFLRGPVLAHLPTSAAIKAELARWIPARDASPAPGSPERFLTFTHLVAVWENQEIGPVEPISEL